MNNDIWQILVTGAKNGALFVIIILLLLIFWKLIEWMTTKLFPSYDMLMKKMEHMAQELMYLRTEILKNDEEVKIKLRDLESKVTGSVFLYGDRLRNIEKFVEKIQENK